MKCTGSPLAFSFAGPLIVAPSRLGAAHRRASRRPRANARRVATAKLADVSENKTWACASGCGACCWLGDYDVGTLLELLKTPQDVETYLAMVGRDGWCTHFDKGARACTVYESRPRFCRVDFDVFRSLYGVADEEEMNSFSIECCETHISAVYPALGEESESAEMKRFHDAISGAGE